ncbi:MAG: CapA family protein [Ruminiclostridium sp.]|nr:CapA family protein [Ruminiclostridium sp.]
MKKILIVLFFIQFLFINSSSVMANSEPLKVLNPSAYEYKGLYNTPVNKHKDLMNANMNICNNFMDKPVNKFSKPVNSPMNELREPLNIYVKEFSSFSNVSLIGPAAGLNEPENTSNEPLDPVDAPLPPFDVPVFSSPTLSQEADRFISHAIESALESYQRHPIKEDSISRSEEFLAIETITLSFAGDCTLGGDEKYTGNTFDKVYEKVNDPAYFFKGVQSVFGADDFTFVNLEGTLTNATKKAEKEYRYRGDPSYTEILMKGSVEGVTLANNHTLDYFDVGYDDTISALDSAGIYPTNFESCFIRDIKGIKIGFLGYKGWGHESKSHTLLEKQVKEMREQGVNFIVANYHWGDMRVYKPNEQQKRMAHFAIDHGVDLVIGHHPHVLQGMETYKGKNILYSLGNFCYGGSSNPGDKDTIIYQHQITYDKKHGEIINSEHKIIPARITSDPGRNNYQPIIAAGDEETRIMRKFEELSGKINK